MGGLRKTLAVAAAAIAVAIAAVGVAPAEAQIKRSVGLTRGNPVNVEVFNRPKRERRVINGRPVKKFERSSGAHFLARFFLAGTTDYYCAGAMLTYRSVLTAAHCFAGYEAESLSDDVKLGGVRLFDGFEAKIEKIVIHPDYNDVTFENDVAIVTIRNAPAPREFEEKGLGLARLGYRGRVKVGTTLRQSGWGATNVNVTQTDPNRQTLAVSEALLYQDMLNNDMAVCNKFVKDIIGLDEVNNPRTHLCGSINDNVAICSGDSGSPVFTQSTTRTGRIFYYVEGVVSFSYEGTTSDCDPAWPDFFSRVSTYYSFIRRNLSYRYTTSS